MNIIPVALIALACYAAGYIHGEWSLADRLFKQTEIHWIQHDETTVDREIPTKKFI